MNNTVELNNKLNAYLEDEIVGDAFLDAMEKATTVEELLIIKWQSKLRGINRSLRNKCFHKNVERISYNNTLENASSIIYDLINNTSLDSIKDKYNVTTTSIKNLLTTYYLKGEYKDKITVNDNLFKKVINPNQERELISARVAIKMFIENKCYSNTTIYSKFNCHAEEYYKYLDILKEKGDPLYKEYKRLNRNHTSNLHAESKIRYYDKKTEERRKEIENISMLDPSSVIELLADPNIEDRNYVNFCIHYGLDNRVLKQLLNDNDELKYEIASNLNKESITNIYNEYINRYKNLVRKVIREIASLSKDNFNKPFDLYHYYNTTKYNIHELASLARSFTDVKNSTIIHKYFEKYYFLIQCVYENDIEGYKHKRVMSCAKETINFTTTDLSNALKDIDENDLPKVKDVLYGAIKRQVELRDSKIKTKVLK